MNEFADDNAWQRAMRDRFIVPYYERVLSGRYQLLDDEPFFQARGADTLIDGPDYVIWVDEKIVRWPGYKYNAFALETHSCTIPGHEKDGWMVYGEADWMLYCFEQEAGNDLECWWVNFKSLKGWFRSCWKEFNVFQMSTKNRTKGRVVPIEIVRTNVPCRKFMLKDAAAC